MAKTAERISQLSSPPRRHWPSLRDVPADGARVEAALVVDARWRRQGLGRALLDAARDWAANHRITSVRLIFGRHNWPMRKLVAKANARLDIVLDDICSEIAIRRKSEPTHSAASASRSLAPADSGA